MGVWTFNVIDPLEFSTALFNKSIEYIHRGVKLDNDSIVMSSESEVKASLNSSSALK